MSYVEDVRPRLRVPATAAAGEVIEIRTLISHPMESGHRPDAEGNRIPRLIITTMSATFNGEEVFRATWSSGIAANPYQAFMLRVDEPGELEIVWQDEAGNEWRDAATIAIG
jgi:sulfur-oxidizing protein SoxZ